MTTLPCTWCGKLYTLRANGGTLQEFCSTPCRREFHTACRRFAVEQVRAGLRSVSDIKHGLGQRARSLRANPRPGPRQAPSEVSRDDGRYGIEWRPQLQEGAGG